MPRSLRVRVGDALEQAHHVVGEIADGAGDQRRQARQAHRAVALDAVAQEIERIRLRPGDAAFAFEHASAVDVAEDLGRVGADEGIARDFFSALDAFEQAGVARVARQAQVGADRREQIGREMFPRRAQGCPVAPAGKMSGKSGSIILSLRGLNKSARTRARGGPFLGVKRAQHGAAHGRVRRALGRSKSPTVRRPAPGTSPLLK